MNKIYIILLLLITSCVEPLECVETPLKLNNTEYKLIMFNGNYNSNYTNYTIEFKSNSKFNLQLECNSFTGKYQLIDNSITFTEVSQVTRINCPNNYIDEVDFVANLKFVNNVNYQNNMLNFNENNITTMQWKEK
jgi:heat shock protein HslJ